MIRQPHGYLFGEFEIEPDAAELRRAGEVVHLEPRVLQLLVYLIEHRERLVPKRELLDAVWDEQFVTENALTKAVGRLRKALDDDAQHPAYIHTHHTLGYRFIAEVRESSATEGAGAESGARDRPASPRGRRLRVVIAVGAMVALGAVAVLIGLGRRAARDRLGGARTVPEVRSLAVLPLANLSGDPQQEYFVEGVQEALITDLARITSLRVVSRRSAMRFRDSEQTAPDIARQLGVDALVEGSVMREGDRVGIWANLIHGPSDRHLWAASYERDVESVLVLTNDVARTISSELEIALTPEEGSQPSVPRRVDPEAHEVYLRARHFLNQFTQPGVIKAQELFRQAIALDPTFAPAHSGLAYAHLIAALGTPPREAVPPARAAARKAIELDDGIAEAYTVLGWARLGDWDWPGAREALERALELNPCEPAARHAYADYLTAIGRPEEGLEHIMIGRECDPLSPLAHVPVLGHLSMLGRNEEVMAESRKAIELFPDWAWARYKLAWALFLEGRYEEAFAEFRVAPNTDPEIREAFDRGFAEDGPRGVGRAMAELLAARAESEYIDPLRVAGHFARAEQPEEAMRWLEQAFENRSGTLVLMRVDPDLEPLHSDPRFQELVRRIGFPE